MLRDLTLGLSVSLAAMLIHLAGTLLLVRLMQPFHDVLRKRVYLRFTIALATTYVVLLAAHVLEVTLWGVVYHALGLVPHAGDAFYSAFVNYTTLGYGDSLQVAEIRLLGPLAAANGILMFGWSTAILILVVQRHLPTAFTRQLD